MYATLTLVTILTNKTLVSYSMMKC